MTHDLQAERLASLSEREKETLRLLVAGHDAKSMARSLSLSVHTVNERLRDARRKLRVSSSREAARLLAEAEAGNGAPNSIGDKQFGVAEAAPDLKSDGASIMRRSGGHPLAWLGGGMLIMSVIVAAVAAAAIFVSSQGPAGAGPAASPRAVAENAETKAARDWVLLLDRQRWDDSWEAAGSAFKSLPKDRWGPMALAARQPLGAVSSRVVETVNRTTSLPGAPAGEYQVIQFRTRFAQKPDAVETVVLSHEPAGWRVNGYFIR